MRKRHRKKKAKKEFEGYIEHLRWECEQCCCKYAGEKEHPWRVCSETCYLHSVGLSWQDFDRTYY